MRYNILIISILINITAYSQNDFFKPNDILLFTIFRNFLPLETFCLKLPTDSTDVVISVVYNGEKTLSYDAHIKISNISNILSKYQFLRNLHNPIVDSFSNSKYYLIELIDTNDYWAPFLNIKTDVYNFRLNIFIYDTLKLISWLNFYQTNLKIMPDSILISKDTLFNATQFVIFDYNSSNIIDQIKNYSTADTLEDLCCFVKTKYRNQNLIKRFAFGSIFFIIETYDTITKKVHKLEAVEIAPKYIFYNKYIFGNNNCDTIVKISIPFSIADSNLSVIRSLDKIIHNNPDTEEVYVIRFNQGVPVSIVGLKKHSDLILKYKNFYDRKALDYLISNQRDTFRIEYTENFLYKILPDYKEIYRNAYDYKFLQLKPNQNQIIFDYKNLKLKAVIPNQDYYNLYTKILLFFHLIK